MPTPTSFTFADHAAVYIAAGLVGTIYLPHAQKFPPPPGFTGEDGVMPTAEDIAAWSARGEQFNLGLRLDEGLLGVDVDAHDGKPGASTLADLEATLGGLPPTYVSTSRGDGVSGIRLYTIEPGLDLPNQVGPGIDVVRFGHRCVVAYPSIHPKTGAPYRWTAPDGSTVEYPNRADVPPLPRAWAEYLSGGRASAPRLTRSAVDVDAWLGALPDGEPCEDVAEVLDRARLALASGESRYDAMVSGTMALVFRGHAGCPGVVPALFALQDEYEAAVAGDPARDRGEWLRSLRGAVEKTAGASVEDYERCSLIQAERLAFDYAPAPSIWDERPILRHLFDFARGRRVAPIAVLGVALARIVAATPSNVVLPPTIGGDLPLNLFVAFVGASVQGKGSAEAAATDAIDLSG